MVAGRLAIVMAAILIPKLRMSDTRWAASVRMARLCAKTPPNASTNMKKVQKQAASSNLRI